jgi:hypothetical protein
VRADSGIRDSRSEASGGNSIGFSYRASLKRDTSRFV